MSEIASTSPTPVHIGLDLKVLRKSACVFLVHRLCVSAGIAHVVTRGLVRYWIDERKATTSEVLFVFKISRYNNNCSALDMSSLRRF